MKLIKNLYTFLRQGWQIIVVIFALAFILGYFSRPDSDNQHNHEAAGSDEQVTWTCSMHPQIRQPNPGKCPICAMDLIPLKQSASDEDIGPTQLKLSETAMKLAAIQTSKVERKAVSQEIPVFGKVEVDETRYQTISSWIAGRIEKLYVDYTGSVVKQGDPLLELYSPDLFVAQQEYLNAKAGGGEFLSLEIVRKKLELLGLRDEQIKELENRGTALEYMNIKAPIGGTVIQKSVKEGQYVNVGSDLYDIADLSIVWIYMNIYEKDIALFDIDQKITFEAEAYPGEKFSGKIDFIDPVMDQTNRTINVRASAPNPKGLLKPGLFVQAKVLTGTGGKNLVIPASAVLSTGKRAVVYLALGNGLFEGREISVGARVGDYFVVKDGLTENQTVVTNGSFKIDSEMQIHAKKSMMNPEGISMTSAHNHGSMSSSEMETMNRESINNTKMESTFSPDLLAQLDDIYQSYFKLQNALSHDKFIDVSTTAITIVRAIQNVKGKFGAHQGHWEMMADKLNTAANNVGSASNMVIARSEFKKLSDTLIEITKVFGTSGNLSIMQFHCPMAFNDTGADWLQDFEQVENPYFGAKMFNCGTLEKTHSKGGQK